MSVPTYRIDAEWDGHSGMYYAKVVRLSDERLMRGFHHESIEQAVALAQQYVFIENEPSRGHKSATLYVGDDGRPVEAHSVKAS